MAVTNPWVGFYIRRVERRNILCDQLKKKKIVFDLYICIDIDTHVLPSYSQYPHQFN